MTGWIEDEFGLPIAGAAALPFTVTIWDGGATIWDGGATIWDRVYHPPAANGSGDILLLWDNRNTIGDWLIAEGDVQTGQDLETACLVSLFTDRLATPDFVPTDGTSDRRGWWADPYNDQPLGSNLWQLERAHKTRDTLGLARRHTLDALGWLVEDGIARTVEVDTRWVGPAGSTLLGIAVTITKPDGSATRFLYGWAWEGLATLASPVMLPR